MLIECSFIDSDLFTFEKLPSVISTCLTSGAKSSNKKFSVCFLNKILFEYFSFYFSVLPMNICHLANDSG